LHDTVFLGVFFQTLDAREQEYEDMMSDSTIYKIGSGDRQLNIGGGIHLETDDEDLNGSGSGSGEGSGQDESDRDVAPRRFSFYII